MKKNLTLFSLIVASLVIINTTPTLCEPVDIILNPINITINNEQIAAKGEFFTLDNGDEVPFSIMFGNTSYVPLAKIAEIFGIEVSWNNESSTASLSGKTLEVISSDSDTKNNYDFRNTRWGDDPDTVIMCETADYFEKEKTPELVDNILLFVGKIDTFNSSIIYKFDPIQGLYSTMYDIDNNHTIEQFYISDYDKIKNLLILKYGDPKEDEILTLNNTASMTDVGSALKYGYIVYRTKWSTDNTEIMLAMGVENYDIKTVIQYSSVDIIPNPDISDF